MEEQLDVISQDPPASQEQQDARRKRGRPLGAVAKQPGLLRDANADKREMLRLTQKVAKLKLELELAEQELKYKKEEVIKKQALRNGNHTITFDCSVCLEIVHWSDCRVLVPCGHCFCMTCCDKFEEGDSAKCPKCRVKITKTTKMYA